MTVAAPPQPSRVNESAGPDPGEALIKEAKQRARRRRWIHGGVAAAVVAVAAGVAGYTSLPRSTPPPPNHATPDVPTPPAVPLGAPLVVGPDAASTLVTSYGQIAWGYVFVYADGRVIWSADGASAEERTLSQRGLELVRAGRLAARNFPAQSFPSLQADGQEDVWAEPTHTKYQPSHYAICFVHPSGPLDATQGAAQLPAPAQALLHGKEQHIYDPTIGAPWSLARRPEECFKVTGVERTTLLQMFNMSPTNDTSEYFVQLGGVNMSVSAIYPHGQYVHWGG